jgi:succinyldiaminopimelate transaminase
LAPYAARAKANPNGGIDLSQGTPVDATPEFIQKALIESANSPSYPVTIGTPELRQAIKDWASNQLGATGDFDFLPTIGSKELVAWLPSILQKKNIIYPKIAYPTYLVGAMIHGAKATEVEIDARTWPKSDLAWINSPSNPTGRIHSESELMNCIEYARSNNSLLVSDECYLNFPSGDLKPVSILKLAKGNNKNLLAVHSLSKRSNLAGYRAALIVGDPEIISEIREVRKHAGMMVPLPVQRAMTAALKDETHVQAQAARYAERRKSLVPALSAAGFKVEFSDAGLYIWCTRGESDWDSVSWLADLGIIATPGHFYGPEGAKHIRIALTATDEQIADAAARILISLKK